jgi:hypothetical protein
VIALTLADASPTPKDVVVAILGASSVLAGLVLVFLGVIISSLHEAVKDFESGEAPETSTWRKIFSGLAKAAIALAWIVVFYLVVPVFAVSMASIGLSLAWLALPAGGVVYDVDIWLFVAELLLITALGAAILYAFYLTNVKGRTPWS